MIAIPSPVLPHRTLSALALVLAGLAMACTTEETVSKDSAEPSEIDQAWAAYDIPPPSAETSAMLNEQAFLWPEQICVSVDSLSTVPADATLTVADDGTEQLCFWDAFSGNVPFGMQFTDLSTCEAAFSQGPPWFSPPARVHVSDDAVLDDAAWVEESTWVQEQVRTSGCSCCHASDAGSGFTSGFDFDAPGVWTDSMSNAQLSMAAGIFDEHTLFGHFEADVNQGFNREHTLFASTDPDRMAAFFTAEFERRSGDNSDLEEAAGQFDALFGRLFLEPVECITPYEGMIDGKLLWNSGQVRQLYVLEVDAMTPGFPPNLDRPDGTVWALYVSPDAPPIDPGTLALGEVPEGTWQSFPADGTAPTFESGRTYRLYGTPDVMIPSALDCLTTF